MRIHSAFVLSTYVCVSLATFCLGYVEQEEMKSTAPFYTVIGLLFVVAYLSEDRFKLSNAVANTIALPLFGCWLLWVYSNVSGTTTIEEIQDYFRVLVPFGPPLLAVLTLVKLFRSKNVRDYWGLHILALFQMVMACCMAYISRMDREDPLFGLLLGAYVLAAIWSLHLFYLRRESAASDGVSYPRSYVLPHAKVESARGAPPALSHSPSLSHLDMVPGRLLGLPAGMGWFVATALLGVAVFTVFFSYFPANPEGTGSIVTPGKATAQVGFSTSVDLTQNVPIRVSDALVMRVQAVDAAGKPVFLGKEQRWRGVTCSQYQAGRWTPLRSSQEARPLDDSELPPQRGRQLLLNYAVNLSELGSGGRIVEEAPRGGLTGPRPLFLADPLYIPRPLPGDRNVWRGGVPLVALLNPPEWVRHQSLYYRINEPLLTLKWSRLNGTLRYQQIHEPPQENTPESEREVDINAGYANSLHARPSGVRGWDRLAAKAEEILALANVPNDARLRRRAERGELDAANERQERERQAHALERYLSFNPEYSYSLERREVDPDLDPTVDFLVSGRQGHCQLFASALALMLRSQGIPARVIIGFRGTDWLGAGEIHEVRQFHAHTWVEAFLESQDQLGKDRHRGRWLTLDPTPGGGTATVYHESSESDTTGFEEELHFARFLWEALILDYTGDVRPDRYLAHFLPDFSWLKWQSIRENGLPAGAWAFLIAVAIVVPGFFLTRRRARQRRIAAKAQAALVPFYARWLRLMQRLGLEPALSQTPAEFANAVSGQLSVVRCPNIIVELFYAIRFGGRVPEPAQLAAVEQELDRLEKAVSRQ